MARLVEQGFRRPNLQADVVRRSDPNVGSAGVEPVKSLYLPELRRPALAPATLPLRAGAAPAARSPLARAVLGRPEPLGEGLQEVPGDRGVVLHERAELPERQAVADDITAGGHRRRPRPLVDQGGLTEVVASRERGHLLAVYRDGGLPGVDDVEGGCADALLGDRLTGRNLRSLNMSAMRSASPGLSPVKNGTCSSTSGEPGGIWAVGRRRPGPGDGTALEEVEGPVGDTPTRCRWRVRRPPRTGRPRR